MNKRYRANVAAYFAKKILASEDTRTLVRIIKTFSSLWDYIDDENRRRLIRRLVVLMFEGSFVESSKVLKLTSRVCKQAEVFTHDRGVPDLMIRLSKTHQCSPCVLKMFSDQLTDAIRNGENRWIPVLRELGCAAPRVVDINKNCRLLLNR